MSHNTFFNKKLTYSGNRFFYRSSHECSLGVKSGVLAFSSCAERHLFKPFSAGESGAATEQTRTLTLVGQAAADVAPDEVLSPGFERKGLAFEHSEPGGGGGAEDVAGVLATVNSVARTPEIDRPKVFNELVHRMRKLK